MVAQAQTVEQILTGLYVALEKVSNELLAEPLKGASLYAAMVAQDPKIDAKICSLVGKIVHVIASVPYGTQCPITIRGDKSPLDWYKDLPADEPLYGNAPDDRTFTFHIPTSQMNEQIQFKLCMVVHPYDVRWSNNNNNSNWTVDLKSYGHIAKIEIGRVTFA